MTLKRKFRTEKGFAIRLMSFEPGKAGAEIVTGYYRKGEKSPYRVTTEIIA